MKQKFSKKIFADQDAFHMSCPEVVGRHLAEELSRFNSAIELCSAVGMTVIQLAGKIDKVIGVDLEKSRINDARKNAKLYGVENKVEFIIGDALDYNLLKNLSAEVAVLDPDWNIKETEKLTCANKIDGTLPSMREMFNLTKRYITSNIVIRVPKYFTFETLSEFGLCKLENIAWGGEIKFKIAYFLNDIKENSEANFSFDN